METLFTELRQVFQDEYIHLGKHLRVVQTQAILFLESMSVRGGSDISRL